MGSFFRVLVVLLGISQLIFSNAIPITRTRSLMQGPNVQLDDTHRITVEESGSGEFLHGESDVEVLDYPGSGANNRHTPRAQMGRCYDC